jgi:hypothetical protein
MHTSRGTFDAHCRTIQDLPARILAALTPQEQEQLEEWVDRRALQRRIARRPYSSPVMDRIIATAATVTEIATEVLPDITIHEDDLKKLVAVWRKFSHALERQGWSLPVTFSSTAIEKENRATRLTTLISEAMREE